MQHPSPPKCSPPIKIIKQAGGLQTLIQATMQPDTQCPPKHHLPWRPWKPYLHKGEGRYEFPMSSDICPLWRASLTQVSFVQLTKKGE